MITGDLSFLFSSFCLVFYFCCSPTWYCLSLSESLKQRVKEFTWEVFSWSTDRASMAWQEEEEKEEKQEKEKKKEKQEEEEEKKKQDKDK